MQRRRFIGDLIRSIEQECLERLERTPGTEPHAIVLLARLTGSGIETADLVVHELLRNMRDRRAVARYAPVRRGAMRVSTATLFASFTIFVVSMPESVSC